VVVGAVVVIVVVVVAPLDVRLADSVETFNSIQFKCYISFRRHDIVDILLLAENISKITQENEKM